MPWHKARRSFVLFIAFLNIFANILPPAAITVVSALVHHHVWNTIETLERVRPLLAVVPGAPAAIRTIRIGTAKQSWP
jgi:hypothetical protein